MGVTPLKETPTYRQELPRPVFYVDAVDLNWVPHVCTAVILPTEPFSEPFVHLVLYICFICVLRRGLILWSRLAWNLLCSLDCLQFL